MSAHSSTRRLLVKSQHRAISPPPPTRVVTKKRTFGDFSDAFAQVLTIDPRQDSHNSPALAKEAYVSVESDADVLLESVYGKPNQTFATTALVDDDFQDLTLRRRKAVPTTIVVDEPAVLEESVLDEEEVLSLTHMSRTESENQRRIQYTVHRAFAIGTFSPEVRGRLHSDAHSHRQSSPEKREKDSGKWTAKVLRAKEKRDKLFAKSLKPRLKSWWRWRWGRPKAKAAERRGSEGSQVGLVNEFSQGGYEYGGRPGAYHGRVTVQRGQAGVTVTTREVVDAIGEPLQRARTMF